MSARKTATSNMHRNSGSFTTKLPERPSHHDTSVITHNRKTCNDLPLSLSSFTRVPPLSVFPLSRAFPPRHHPSGLPFSFAKVGRAGAPCKYRRSWRHIRPLFLADWPHKKRRLITCLQCTLILSLKTWQRKSQTGDKTYRKVEKKRSGRKKGRKGYKRKSTRLQKPDKSNKKSLTKKEEEK